MGLTSATRSVTKHLLLQWLLSKVTAQQSFNYSATHLPCEDPFAFAQLPSPYLGKPSITPAVEES